MDEAEAELVKSWPDILGKDEQADLAVARHLISLGLFDADSGKREMALATLLGAVKEALYSQLSVGYI